MDSSRPQSLPVGNWSRGVTNFFLILAVVVITKELGNWVVNNWAEEFIGLLPLGWAEKYPLVSPLRDVCLSQMGSIIFFPVQVFLLLGMVRCAATKPEFASQVEGVNVTPRVICLMGLFGVTLSQCLWFGLGAALRYFPHQETISHPLNLVLENMGLFGFLFVFFQACIMAPFLEEIVCRGYLQGILCVNNWGFSVGLLLACLLLYVGVPERFFEVPPILFATILIGGLFFCLPIILPIPPIPILSGRPLGKQFKGGMLGTTLIFCAIHAPAWPSPFALLPLSWVISWVRAGGGGLWACVLIHAAFNLTSLGMVGLIRLFS